jgi:hypothetical protein
MTSKFTVGHSFDLCAARSPSAAQAEYDYNTACAIGRPCEAEAALHASVQEHVLRYPYGIDPHHARSSERQQPA